MGAILLSLATFFSTLIGGLLGLRYRDHLNLNTRFYVPTNAFLDAARVHYTKVQAV